jgi:hypothetical protein
MAKKKLPAILSKEQQLAKIDENRKNLPQILAKRNSQVKKAISNWNLTKYEDENAEVSLKAMESLKVSRLAFHPIMETYNEVLYSPNEMRVLFDYFADLCLQLNTAFGFVPQLGHFTRFIDISETKFKHWRNTGSAELQEICNKIVDDLSTNTMDAMLQKKIPEVSGMFLEKTRYERRDNTEVPKQIIQAQNVLITDEEMLSLAQEYKKMK